MEIKDNSRSFQKIELRGHGGKFDMGDEEKEGGNLGENMSSFYKC